MSSVSERVFSTPELLETILSYLAPINLLQAQLISHLFHSTITSSPKLQQLLFFRPAHHLPETWTLNPLLRKHFLPWFVISSSRTSNQRDLSTLQLLEWISSDSQRDAFLRADASWRNMVFMQPAPTSLHLVRWTHAMRADYEDKATIPVPGGKVTMGLVYDVTVSVLRHDARMFPSFGLAVHDGPAGVGVTLYFKRTAQCCMRRMKVPDFSSRGAEELEFEWKEKEEEEEKGGGDDDSEEEMRRDMRLPMKWTTDLTEERGGVGNEEWKVWERKRKHPEDLMSSSGEDVMASSGEDVMASSGEEE
jgi:hypothetical protein